MNIQRSSQNDARNLTCRIVAAYVSNNALPSSEIEGLIQITYKKISSIIRHSDRPEDTIRPKANSSEIEDTIRDFGIVSFIDGKIYKTLKRHLRTHGLDPESYRERYGLPPEYPMVASDYAKLRSDLAKRIKLGQPGGMAEREREDRHAA